MTGTEAPSRLAKDPHIEILNRHQHAWYGGLRTCRAGETHREGPASDRVIKPRERRAWAPAHSIASRMMKLSRSLRQAPQAARRTSRSGHLQSRYSSRLRILLRSLRIRRLRSRGSLLRTAQPLHPAWPAQPLQPACAAQPLQPPCPHPLAASCTAERCAPAFSLSKT